MSQSVDLNGVPKEAGPPRVSLRAGFKASLREHALLIAMVAAYLLVGAATSWTLGRPLHFQPDLTAVAGVIWLIGFWSVLIAAVVGFAAAAIRRGGAQPLRAALRWLREDFLRTDRVWGTVIVFALLPVFGWNFGFMKALIPVLHPFDWDPTFAAWDRLLHFGRHPWEWLQPALGIPAITAGLSFNYALWFFVLYGVSFWQALDRRNPTLRMQYLLSTTVMWALLGSVGGTLLASGGPIYYGRLTGLPDPFGPLIQYLDAANGEWLNFSRGIQEKLWDLCRGNRSEGDIACAISAMPSLHVASSCGFYLVARASNRWLGRIFLVFLMLMLLGSVHLGWHYAIDGYVGIAGAVAIWWCCGRLVRWPVMQRLLWGETQRATHPSVSSSD
jgi:hypothetical protein